MSAYFVTAIGTDVGKTFTSCALLYAARARGVKTHGYKPVISGWDDADASMDTLQIIAACSGTPSPLGGEGWDEGALGLPETSTPLTQPSPPRGEGSAVATLKNDIQAISPWRFAAPLSPHRAAALEGKAIDFDALVAWSQDKLHVPDGASEEKLVLIEGVGGVMVPLTDTHTSLDWMRALNLPVILVVGTYLGSISHTLTALAVLKQAGVRVAALVMNESAGSSVTLAEAEAGLAPFVADIPLRVVQPRVSCWREAKAIQTLVEQLR